MTTLTLLFATMSLKYGLPQGLLSSLCYVESKHKITAIHHDDGGADSLGICQIKLATAKQMGFKGTAKELMKPVNNIKYAAKFLQHNIHRYNSVAKGVICYNLGHAGNLTTSKYQQKVFKQWSKK